MCIRDRHNRAYWDYVDDALMQEKKGLCRITFYLEDSPDGYNTLSREMCIRDRDDGQHPRQHDAQQGRGLLHNVPGKLRPGVVQPLGQVRIVHGAGRCV